MTPSPIRWRTAALAGCILTAATAAQDTYPLATAVATAVATLLFLGAVAASIGSLRAEGGA